MQGKGWVIMEFAFAPLVSPGFFPPKTKKKLLDLHPQDARMYVH